MKSSDFRKLEKQLKGDKKRTYSDATRTTPSPHTQPPTHPFLPHPPGNSCQLAPVHPFLLNTMQGRKHLPSLLKTNQPTGLPCWAKNFQAKFLMFRGLSSQSVSQSVSWQPQSHTMSTSLPLYTFTICCPRLLCRKTKAQKEALSNQCLLLVAVCNHVWWTESMDLKISVTLYFSRSTPPVHTRSAACLRLVLATVNIQLSFYP